MSMEDQHYEELPSSIPGAANSNTNNNRNRTKLWLIPLLLLLVIILVVVGFFVWPRNPKLEITDVDFKGMNLNTTDGLSLDVNLDLIIQVNNPNYIGVDYDRVTAHIFYRGDELGKVNSSGGHISARDSVDLNATLKLESLSILKHAPELISDVASDKVPVSTRADFFGNLNIISIIKPGLKVTISCELLLNPDNSSVLRKDCEEKLFSNNILLLGSKTNSALFWSVIGGILFVLLVVVGGLVWVFWPKPPEMTVESVQLRGFSADSKMPEDSYIPEVVLDINLGLTLKIRNRYIFGATYDKITVFVYYSGYEVCKGEVAEGGVIRARDTAEVNASLDLRGAEIVTNSAQLLTDVASRELPMNLLIQFSGNAAVWWCRPPHIKATVSYDLMLDPVSTEILSQDYHFK